MYFVRCPTKAIRNVDFIVEELHRREPEDPSRIGATRVALQNQRNNLLAFAGVLNQKLGAMDRASGVSDHLVRATCLLHRKPDTSVTFWQAWNRLHAAIGHKFHDLYTAVSQARR
ncbi:MULTISPECIES: hypothetical protein [Paraburkholderia]|uniref:hypothetical protein n=1 Tax=Paraburkholderia TaxID=1822464 RepID=UPI000371C7AB|nr:MULTISPECIES: hypothetical protein [Paraburkholderia]MDH6150429.1 hypothetical protein [Paraburkholderia sp. WSM4179]